MRTRVHQWAVQWGKGHESIRSMQSMLQANELVCVDVGARGASMRALLSGNESELSARGARPLGPVSITVRNGSPRAPVSVLKAGIHAPAT